MNIHLFFKLCHKARKSLTFQAARGSDPVRNKQIKTVNKNVTGHSQL